MSLRFILYVGWRMFRARRGSSGLASSFLSVAGVAVGAMVLTSVLGVMNGFQLGFIESILEVSSYHLQVTLPEGRALDEETRAALAGLAGVRSLVPFTENQAIAEGLFSRQRGCLVRGVPQDVMSLDPGFRRRVEVVEGRFDLGDPGTITLGMELARLLGVETGDSISLLTLSGPAYGDLRPVRREFRIGGLFRTGYYEYDAGLAFLSLEAAGETFWAGEAPPLTYGLKLEDRLQDRRATARVEALLADRDLGEARVGSWREYNRAFFGALLMEKVIMILLIGLIFIVVGFNIYQTLRRSVRERFEEISVLKALGAPSGAVCTVFVLGGFLTGLLGGGLGLAAGLLVAGNINEVFGLAEDAINATLHLLNWAMANSLPGVGSERFAIFSPAYFYLLEVPSRVLFSEALMIVLFGLISSTGAAFLASRRVTEVRPVEILRYE